MDWAPSSCAKTDVVVLNWKLLLLSGLFLVLKQSILEDVYWLSSNWQNALIVIWVTWGKTPLVLSEYFDFQVKAC